MACFEAGSLYPERALLDGLSVRTAHAMIRAFKRGNLRLAWMTADDIAAMTDADLLMFREIGPKTLTEIRSRFPYRAEEAV